MQIRLLAQRLTTIVKEILPSLLAKSIWGEFLVSSEKRTLSGEEFYPQPSGSSKNVLGPARYALGTARFLKLGLHYPVAPQRGDY